MELHQFLNYAKGVIICRDLLHIILEEIKIKLSEQSVINVTWNMRTESEKNVTTASLILTLVTLAVPVHIYVGYILNFLTHEVVLNARVMDT